MPVVDKVGQTFGRLTVLRLSEKRHPKNNKILWECKCSCGNPEIVYATTGNLTQGTKTSCGCAKKEQLKKIQQQTKKDLTNQSFGRLTAIYCIENTSPPLWHCVCECGNEVDVISNQLTRKRTTSCGCGRKDLRISLIGEKFGKLTVLERVENYISPSGQQQIQYKCKCDCGNETIVMAASLKQGLTQSCGCIRSAGEMVIAKYLKEQNIKFQQEFRFEDCRDDRPLPFDFCIFDDNGNIKLLIEVNGKQHYEPRYSSDPEVSQRMFELQQKHDKIKEIYCLENNINFLVIPFYDLNRYKEIINERIK